jgi:hypothetical protein
MFGMNLTGRYQLCYLPAIETRIHMGYARRHIEGQQEDISQD